jgi:hypothetical protein
MLNGSAEADSGHDDKPTMSLQDQASAYIHLRACIPYNFGHCSTIDYTIDAILYLRGFRLEEALT